MAARTATLSPVVLSRGTIHAAGPYALAQCPASGRAVATNAPPHGAFRGFGAPQSIFALERHMDRLAAAVGLSPDEFRRRNFISPGDTSTLRSRRSASRSIWTDFWIERCDLTDYRGQETAFARDNTPGSVEKGIGFATFMHGAGFTGSGESAS